MKTKNSIVSAKARVIIAALVTVGIAGGVVALWHHHRKQANNQAVAAVAGGPDIASIPGAGNPSNRYVKNQNLQNTLEAQKARKEGTSAIPTIVRPSFIGSPNAFGTLDNAASSNGSTAAKYECPIKKVVVMFKPNPSSCTVANLKLARQTGVTAEELLCQGCSCPALKLAGYTVGDLKNIGFTATQLHHCGFKLGQLIEAGFSAAQLKNAGYSAKQLANDGFTAGQLAAAGFSPSQIQKAGYTPEQLKLAGVARANCDVAAMRKAREQGVSAATLKKEGCGVVALKAAGFTAAQIKAADKTSKDCNVLALRKARASGVSVVELKNKGCGLAALKAAGYTAAQLKAAGFTAAQLKKLGYTAADLKNAGFSAAQLKAAGYSAAALKKAGYTASQLKTAGFSAGQLKAVGFSAKQLKAAGFSAKQLRNAGYNAGALKAAGYSAKQLHKAGFSKGDLLRAGYSPKQAGYGSSQAANTARQKQVSAANSAANIAKRLNQDAGASGSSVSIPSINGHSPEARLAAVMRQQQQQMSAQQRQDTIQQLQGAMTMEADRMVNGWNVRTPQVMQKGNPPKVTTNMAGSLAGAGASSAAYAGKVIKAGSVMFAVLDTSINSDERSPIMATIVAGPLKGSKLLGRFHRVNKRVLLAFNLLNDPRYKQSIALNAVAIDPNTARTAISGQVNNHYLLRYGTLFASAFMSGLSNAVLASNSSQHCGLFGCTHTVDKLNTRQQVTYALGTVGTRYANVMGSNFNTPPTVKVKGGTGIGILIMSDLKLPISKS